MPCLNVAANLDDCIAALELMEGYDRLNDHGRSMSLLAAVKVHAEASIEDLEMRQAPAAIPGAVVYGRGGFHRYFICFNGDIVFSAFHASHDKQAIKNAEDLDFRIHR